MTLWIELFFQEIWLDSSNWTSFYEPLFKMTQRVEVFLTQRIEPFLFSNVTQRIEPFFLKTSQRIEPLFHMNFFLHDSKNLTLFFSIWLDFFEWVKELNPFLNMTQRIDLIFQKEYDSKNWTFKKKGWKNVFFFECDSKNWTSFWV